MSYRIMRTQGFSDGFETFESNEEALEWIEANAGQFYSREYIAVVDLETFESLFIRMGQGLLL